MSQPESQQDLPAGYRRNALQSVLEYRAPGVSWFPARRSEPLRHPHTDNQVHSQPNGTPEPSRPPLRTFPPRQSAIMISPAPRQIFTQTPSQPLAAHTSSSPALISESCSCSGTCSSGTNTSFEGLVSFASSSSAVSLRIVLRGPSQSCCPPPIDCARPMERDMPNHSGSHATPRCAAPRRGDSLLKLGDLRVVRFVQLGERRTSRRRR